MPRGPYGPPFDHHAIFTTGAGLGGPALALAATSLLWLAALTWLLWPWIRSRLPARRTRPAASATQSAEEEPPSVEMLRQRYVLGQLDALTFEDMLDRLLASQAREREFSLREAAARAGSSGSWERHALPRSASQRQEEWAARDGAAWGEEQPQSQASPAH